jgi:hypothetical protein
MKSIERDNLASPPPLCGGWFKCTTARALAITLATAFLTAPAYAQTKPGIYTKVNVPGVIGLSAGVGGGVILWAYLHHRKHRQADIKLITTPAEFADIVPGQAAKLTVPVTNPMSAAVQIKELAVEDKSGALALGATRQGSFPLAPGEKYDIPVTITANQSSGKARIRIVVTSEGSTKQAVKYIAVSYGHPKSKLHKLIP